jgi:hypothetical protein
MESCPRCRLRDGIKATLTFELFDRPQMTGGGGRRAAISPAGNEEDRKAA